MNKILILLCLLSFASCRSAKKAIKTNVDTSIVTDIKQEVKTSEKTSIENNLVTETSTVTVKKNYGPPNTPSTQTVGTPEQSISDQKGALISEETTTTTTKQVDKGVLESKKEGEVKTEDNTKQKDNSKIVTKEKSKVPFPWWALAVILAIVSGLLIAFRNSPFVLFFKKLFTKK